MFGTPQLLATLFADFLITWAVDRHFVSRQRARPTHVARRAGVVAGRVVRYSRASVSAR
jgi:hypothetical protein